MTDHSQINSHVPNVGEMLAKIEAAADDLAKDQDIIDFVKRTESNPLPTTQDNYGEYMAFISSIAKDRITRLVVMKALRKAGANQNGVAAAMEILSPR